MAEKRLALTESGDITYCTADEENIGKGRCNHIAHQTKEESTEDFLNRVPDNKDFKYDNGYSGDKMISDEVVRKMPIEDLKIYIEALANPGIKLIEEIDKIDKTFNGDLEYKEKRYEITNLNENFNSKIIQKIEYDGECSSTNVIICYKDKVCGYMNQGETFNEKGVKQTIGKIYSYVSKGLPENMHKNIPTEKWSIVNKDGDIIRDGFVSEEAANSWRDSAIKVGNSQFGTEYVYNTYYSVIKT